MVPEPGLGIDMARVFDLERINRLEKEKMKRSSADLESRKGFGRQRVRLNPKLGPSNLRKAVGSDES